MTVSKSIVHVNEGNIPEKVFCHAEGRPQPSFEWRFSASTSNWIVPGNNGSLSAAQQKQLAATMSGNSGVSIVGSVGNNNQQLVMYSAVNRQNAGYYACVAHNAHGTDTAYTYLNVMCKSKLKGDNVVRPFGLHNASRLIILIYFPF